MRKLEIDDSKGYFMFQQILTYISRYLLPTASSKSTKLFLACPSPKVKFIHLYINIKLRMIVVSLRLN